jgi:Flp pilus assembly protein TadG
MQRQHSAHGGVMVEFSLILPGLVFFILAMFGTGQLLNQSFWYAQTAYQAAYLGAETDSANRQARSKALVDMLEQLHNRNAASRARGMEAREPAAQTLQEEARTVTASLAGRTRTILDNGTPWKETLTSLRLEAAVKAPILVTGATVSHAYSFAGTGASGDYGTYDCCGRPVTDGPTTCVFGGSYDCTGSANVDEVGYFAP